MMSDDDLLLRVWNKEDEGVFKLEKNLIETEIRNLAYYKWEAAGKPECDGFHYWYEAEKEITASLGLDELSSEECVLVGETP